MPYLTSLEGRNTKQSICHYFVELASDKLDHEGIPERFQILDVVVLEPTKEAIKTLIAACGWLQGYTLISHWISDDCPEF